MNSCCGSNGLGAPREGASLKVAPDDGRLRSNARHKTLQEKPQPRNHALCWLFVIRTIMYPALGKGSAQPFPRSSGEFNAVAPFHEMRLVEHILVISSPPHNYRRGGGGVGVRSNLIEHGNVALKRDDAQRMTCGYLDAGASLKSLRPEEVLLRLIGVTEIKVWTNRAVYLSPSDLRCHALGWHSSAIPPSWLYREVGRIKSAVDCSARLFRVDEFAGPFGVTVRKQPVVKAIDIYEWARLRSSEFDLSLHNGSLATVYAPLQKANDKQPQSEPCYRISPITRFGISVLRPVSAVVLIHCGYRAEEGGVRPSSTAGKAWGLCLYVGALPCALVATFSLPGDWWNLMEGCP